MLLLILGTSSCTSNHFDQIQSDKTVKLNEVDLLDFSLLKNLLIKDLVEIRNNENTLPPGADTTFLLTNSYYLYQIDQKSYEPIVEGLKDKNIFVDIINTSHDGTLIFRLKEMTDISSLPNFQYTHTLVWRGKDNFKTAYSGNVEVLVDSIINDDWRYVYSKGQVGH